jgi:predicted transcriptional regulator YdeE
MLYTLAHLPAFTIAGISIRTTNANGQAQIDIGSLWQRFMQQQVQNNIPTKINEDGYCVYTDYESDFNAPYTTIIGCMVSTSEGLPEGVSCKEVAACTYRVYKPVGELPGGIMQTWTYIWQSGIPRAYRADFDVYRPDGSAETYVSINEGE